uniref:Uncharacterized protein n=1 Tax=viral metagenome TaxID=1070528 RepID=A0A6M3KUP4_9ZZZZ
MRPLVCPGGYAVPNRTGKFRIVAITAACSSVSASSRLMLVEDSKAPNSLEQKWISLDGSDTKEKQHTILVDLKRVAACDANIIYNPPEPINTTNGILSIKTDNLEPGSIAVYVE